MGTEADTCGKTVLPELVEAGWDTSPFAFNEQKSFTVGLIVELEGLFKDAGGNG